MNRQDPSPIAAAGDTLDQADTSESTSLGRRRALLSGLGKGGALVAAVAPVSSFAAGRVRTADGKQCTVSGQMSAAMSQAASQLPCIAFHPTHFFSAETLTIDTLTDSGLKTALAGLAINGYLDRAEAVYFKRNATEARRLLPLNRPSGYTDVTLTVSSILAGAANAAVLRQLHGRPNSDATIFLAAFFSTKIAAPGGAEKVPFPDTDVQAQWTGANKVAAAALYRLVCTAGIDLNKLG